MATYKEIKGTQIEVLATDPTYPIEGQVWYNSTSNVVKGQAATTSGSWASSPSVNTGKDQTSGAGTTTAALNFSGGPPVQDDTEKWNGTAWTSVNDMNSGRRATAGSGTQTAALCFGGITSSNAVDLTELYNGTCWAAAPTMGTARNFFKGAGISTATLAFGGATGSGGNPPFTQNVELYNGSSWAEQSGDLNTARSNISAGGTSTSAICAGGYPATGKTETWNGTSFSEESDLNTARFGMGGSGSDKDNAVVFGGGPGSKSETETWNGTSWTETTNMPAARVYTGSTKGSYTAALAISGNSGGPTGSTQTTVQEWVGPGTAQTRTFTDS